MMFSTEFQENWLETEKGHHTLFLHNTSPPAVDHWGPDSQQATTRWSIMSLIGGMSEMATISKGRKQRLEGLGGEGRGEEMERMREEKETERQMEKGRDLLSLEEGVSILYFRSKLGWQGSDKFCACVYVYVYECVCVWGGGARQSEGFW